ncbi:Uncharacterized protein TPAR_07073 [Tolypocladium paradoxum]|uniref:Protein PLANT CADMIUM RESISTANCE 3 n=1 Tax=Tolypocladium paradoxum TaxID=94208 RepID=A0A2S4KRG2_9HYPO|nr:Uncharacterized protein TPAR_07073 [Tolypocladium paradoxum]
MEHTQPPQEQQMQPQQQQQQSFHDGHHAQNRSVQSPKWEASLFNCSPCDSCLLGCFLPCILMGRTTSRMRDPTMQTHEEINPDCLVFFGIQYFTCCGWVYNMIKRREIREQYGIQGSGIGDCCSSFWCLCCSLIQQDNEVRLRTAAHGPITQGYQSQKEGMHMPAPVHQQPGQQPPQQPVQQDQDLGIQPYPQEQQQMQWHDPQYQQKQ